MNTEIFKAHSVRGASTSTAAMAGITMEDILKAADWSNKFYYKPTRDQSFGKVVLSGQGNNSSYKHHVDMGD